MRLQPFDDDTLFQVTYTVLQPIEGRPIGPHKDATFAGNWLEACHFIRNKHGADNADRIEVERVWTLERANAGLIETVYYDRHAPVSEGEFDGALPISLFGG